MSQRIAIIEGGLVANVATYSDDFVPDGVKTVLAPSSVGKGWTFDGASFTPPPTPEPTATGAQMIYEAEARGQLATLLTALSAPERAKLYARRRIIAGDDVAEALRTRLGVGTAAMAGFIAAAAARSEV